MGSIARMDPKLPSNVGTSPGLPLQLLDRNPFSKVIGLNPSPLKGRHFLPIFEQTKKYSSHPNDG